MSEVWEDVVSLGGAYIGKYQVSSEGRVRAHPDASGRGVKPGRILFQSKDDKGYPQCQLYLSQKSTTVKVHRLVAESFIGLRPESATVNHIDGDKSNNLVVNLEYVSNLENIRHAYRTIDTRSSVEVDGMRMSLAEAVERFGVPGVDRRRASARINRHGWPVLLAIKTPIGKIGRPTDLERIQRGKN
jgi:hypothetical protein